MAVKISNIIKERPNSGWRLVEFSEPAGIAIRLMLNDGKCEVLKTSEITLPEFIKILTECFAESIKLQIEKSFKNEKSFKEEKLKLFTFMYNGTIIRVKKDTDWFRLYEAIDIHMGKRKILDDDRAIEIDQEEKEVLFADVEAEEKWKEFVCKKPEAIMSFARRWAKMMQYYNRQTNIIANIAERAKERANVDNLNEQEIAEAAQVLQECWKYRDELKSWLKK